MKNQKAYQKITDRILEELDKGNIPWKQPWIYREQKNYFSKRPYHGINILMLMLEKKPTTEWAAFNQISKAGHKVNKGAKGIPIVFTKRIEIKEENEDGEEEVKYIPFLKYFFVFNINDTNIDYKIEDNREESKDIKNCDEIIENAITNLGLIMTKGRDAYYTPATHSITIPPKENFESSEKYYATVFHELVHATGKALGREMSVIFGEDKYSKEELIAEIGATFLAGICGIENKTIENAGAYIKGWRDKISKDNRLIVSSASKAQEAVNYILGRKLNESREVISTERKR